MLTDPAGPFLDKTEHLAKWLFYRHVLFILPPSSHQVQQELGHSQRWVPRESCIFWQAGRRSALFTCPLSLSFFKFCLFSFLSPSSYVPPSINSSHFSLSLSSLVVAQETHSRVWQPGWGQPIGLVSAGALIEQGRLLSCQVLIILSTYREWLIAVRRGLKREEKDKTSTQKVRKCTKGEKFLANKHAFVLMLPLPKLWNNSSRWQVGRDNMLQGPGAGAALSSWREVYSFKWSVLLFIPLTANNNDDLWESRDKRSRTLPELPSLPSHIFRLSVSVRLGRRCGYHWPRSSSVRLSLLRFHISRSDIKWWNSLLRTASSRAGPQS